MRLLIPLFLLLGLFACGTDTPATEPDEEIISVEQTGGDTTSVDLELSFFDLDLPELYYLVFRQELALQDMNGFLAIESDSLARKAKRAGLERIGPPVSLFYGWDTDRGWGDAAVGIPVKRATKLAPYVRINLPAGKALMLEMEGGYERLSVMHYSLNQEIARLGVKPLPPSIEEYVVGPADTDDPTQFRTRIYYRYEPSTK